MIVTLDLSENYTPQEYYNTLGIGEDFSFGIDNVYLEA